MFVLGITLFMRNGFVYESGVCEFRDEQTNKIGVVCVGRRILYNARCCARIYGNFFSVPGEQNCKITTRGSGCCFIIIYGII